MKVKIIRGPYTDKNIQACYDYIVKKYRKEILSESIIRKGKSGRTSDKRL